MGKLRISEDMDTQVVEGIISDYIHIGLKIANTGEPSGLDAKTWEQCIYQIRHLHVAEPHLPAFEIMNALVLAGWSPPSPTAGEQPETP